jgi:hypothetical protein
LNKKTKKNPKGAGRELLYGEPTKVVPTKVPISKEEQFKKEVKEKILKKWEKKKPS